MRRLLSAVWLLALPAGALESAVGLEQAMLSARAAVARSSVRGQAPPSAPRVRVEGRGAEADALRAALRALYPTLPPRARAVIDEGLVFVVREAPRVGVYGFGPEDDPEYRYPDRELYPRGTIKVNITPFYLKIAGLAARIEDVRLRRSLEAFLGGVLTHEATHALQYRARPVLGLGPGDLCGPLGECDEARLAGTRFKVETYEREAFEADYRHELSAGGVDRAALKHHFEARPGELSAFTPRERAIFLRGTLSPRTQAMGPALRDLYALQYEPIDLAREYRGLFTAEAREPGDACRFAGGFARLKGRYHALRGLGIDAGAAYPYLRRVWPQLAFEAVKADGLLLDDDCP